MHPDLPLSIFSAPARKGRKRGVVGGFALSEQNRVKVYSCGGDLSQQLILSPGWSSWSLSNGAGTLSLAPTPKLLHALLILAPTHSLTPTRSSSITVPFTLHNTSTYTPAPTHLSTYSLYLYLIPYTYSLYLYLLTQPIIPLLLHHSERSSTANSSLT